MPEQIDLLAEFEPVRWVRPFGNGLWRPCGEATGAIDAHCLPVAPMTGNGLLDIVAWAWDRPGTWWRRTGRAGWLGDQWLDDPPNGRSVAVVETPREWLANRCEAVCVLDWRVDLAAILDGAPDLICSTARLAARISTAIAGKAAVRVVAP